MQLKKAQYKEQKSALNYRCLGISCLPDKEMHLIFDVLSMYEPRAKQYSKDYWFLPVLGKYRKFITEFEAYKKKVNSGLLGRDIFLNWDSAQAFQNRLIPLTDAVEAACIRYECIKNERKKKEKKILIEHKKKKKMDKNRDKLLISDEDIADDDDDGYYHKDNNIGSDYDSEENLALALDFAEFERQEQEGEEEEREEKQKYDNHNHHSSRTLTVCKKLCLCKDTK